MKFGAIRSVDTTKDACMAAEASSVVSSTAAAVTPRLTTEASTNAFKRIALGPQPSATRTAVNLTSKAFLANVNAATLKQQTRSVSTKATANPTSAGRIR